MKLRAALLLPLFFSSAFATDQPAFYYPFDTSLQISAVTTDTAGNVYFTGSTSASKLNPTAGAFQPQPHSGTCSYAQLAGAPLPCAEAFVIKVNAIGQLQFATYLGGSGDDSTNAIAVDAQGNIYVAGSTAKNVDQTNSFPITDGAAFTDPTRATGFIAKLNSSGTQLLYSTFMEGAFVSSIALDHEGNVYFAGKKSLLASPFPTTVGAFQPAPVGNANHFPGVAGKLNAAGSSLIYATYLSGGTALPNADLGDFPQSIAVDAEGNAFIAGYTSCTDFPVTPGAFLTKSPNDTVSAQSVFVTKLNAQGTALVYSTYLGLGNKATVRVDGSGAALVAGTTTSPKFPAIGVQASKFNGQVSGFLTRLSLDGSSLVYSTYLPTYSESMDADKAGNVVIAGSATGPALPTGPAAFQPNYEDNGLVLSHSYVARFAPDGRLAGATYLGNSGDSDYPSAIATAPNGSLVVVYMSARSLPCFIGPCSGTIAVSLFPFLTIQNAGSYVASSVAPGEIVALRGYNLGPADGVSPTGADLPTDLGGVSVSFGGYQAPLLYVSENQINAQVPWELAGSTSTTVQISYPGTSATPIPVAVAPVAPGIFYVTNANGSLNSSANPAKPGEFIAIYGTGGGLTSPRGVTGARWPSTGPFAQLFASTSVEVAGRGLTIAYAGASPLNQSGFFQINAELPSDISAPPDATLSLKIGGVDAAKVPIVIAPGR